MYNAGKKLNIVISALTHASMTACPLCLLNLKLRTKHTHLSQMRTNILRHIMSLLLL